MWGFTVCIALKVREASLNLRLVINVLLQHALCAGTVKGTVFDLKFSSDNNVNGTGFFATYRVFETTPDSAVSLPAGSGVQG